MIENIKIQPWVGDYYEQRPFMGKRVLVLGESNHTDGRGESTSNELQRLITNNVQSMVFQGKENFFTKVATVLCLSRGIDLPTREQIESQWHDIAFYNFLSEILPDSRVPTEAWMWEESKGDYLRVLSSLQPEIIIALGNNAESAARESSKEIPIVKIKHPSGGLAYESAVKAIQEAFSRLR